LENDDEPWPRIHEKKILSNAGIFLTKTEQRIPLFGLICFTPKIYTCAWEKNARGEWFQV
jgi:hypothetical protein